MGLVVEGADEQLVDENASVLFVVYEARRTFSAFFNSAADFCDLDAICRTPL